MLDDKRIIKTGRISLPNGNTDNKYKYTKLAHSSKLYGGNTSNQPTFAFKSNTTAMTMDPPLRTHHEMPPVFSSNTLIPRLTFLARALSQARWPYC